jgi:hypothetical protein
MKNHSSLFVSGFAALVLCSSGKAKEKLPVVDCAVLWSHGNFGARMAARACRTQSRLDLNEIEKIKDKLEFKTTRTGPAYIPLTAPFKLTRKMGTTCRGHST